MSVKDWWRKAHVIELLKECDVPIISDTETLGGFNINLVSIAQEYCNGLGHGHIDIVVIDTEEPEVSCMSSRYRRVERLDNLNRYYRILYHPTNIKNAEDKRSAALFVTAIGVVILGIF